MFVQVRAASPTVLINEIMFHPPGTNSLEQWFELYNPNDKSANISGWKITRGVSFTFPLGTVIPADGFLVVAANAAAFHEKNPNVQNYVAGWIGKLNHHIELSDNAGKVINAVEFYSQGEWATRRMTPVVLERQGWEWHQPADGEGPSLELTRSTLSNACAQNWTSSSTPSGTPGEPNSAGVGNAAPFITEVSHWPPIPKSVDSVFITARIIDESVASTAVTLHWRLDGQPAFTPTPMADDGAHQDGVAKDGVYGASVPAQSDHTIVEFYLTAADTGGNTRKYPSFIPPEDSTRTANLLFQFDDAAGASPQPVYRMIMTELERAYLADLGRGCPDSDSDAQMNATWITRDGILSGGSATQVRYNIGVRNRGHGTRTVVPHNYHINIPADHPWKNQAGINLIAQVAHSEVIGSALMRKSGLAMPDSRPVKLYLNGTNLMANGLGNSFGFYAANEQYNNDFIQRAFPLDPGGNAYRGIRDQALCIPSTRGIAADLSWQGADWRIPIYTNAYFKQNNFVADDYSDIFKLIAVLNLQAGTTAETYVDDVQRVLNVEQWMRYMAANTLLDNAETALANGIGDDYALYRGAIDTRFQALPYDLDSVMGYGILIASRRNGLFRMTNLPAMDRFMKTPQFAPIYYKTLHHLATTVFSPAQINPLLDQLVGNFASANAVANMKAFNASHVDYVLSEIPMSLVVTSTLPIVNGYLMSSASSITLTGAANALETRSVLINERPANWVAWRATWSLAGIALSPGVNRLHISALNSSGAEIDSRDLDIWFDDGNLATVGATVAADTRWTAAEGPYNVPSTLTIASGATLTIDPGTTLYFGAAANLTVASGGRLIAEGTPANPIRFTRAPGATTTWGGMTISGTLGSPETRITHSHIEFNNSTAIHSAGGTVFLDHLTFGATGRSYVSLDNSSFIVSHCHFPTPTATFEPAHGGGGIKPGGHGIFYRNFFGAPNGYSDVLDFTGGQRSSGSILYFLENVLIGSADDGLDLDGTDAWVEGNIFMHMHQNGSPDSASAISGGDSGGETSEVTIIGNLIFDCDQAATAKQGDFFTLFNNTIVHITKTGGTDTGSGALNVRDLVPEITTFGKGFYLEGNVIADVEQLVRNNDLVQAPVTFNNNVLPLAWNGPGGGNYIGDPFLKHIPTVAETTFTNWAQAQIMWDWFSPRSASPARKSLPLGVHLDGPIGTNRETAATIKVGINRIVPGWPSGAGYTHYKWRLDAGEWSPETPIDTPISLMGLADGPHSIEAIGKADAGLYQNDSRLGEAARVSSIAWRVDQTLPLSNTPKIRLNEILAKSLSTSDLVELHNYGVTEIDLSGYHLTPRLTAPNAFTFAPGTKIGPGEFIVLHADADFLAEGIHLGFTFDAGGGDVYLLSSSAALIDSISFGRQIPNYSIGRARDGTWTLCQPTFGAANIPQACADPKSLRINEWLCDREFAAADNFVELYNPSLLPADLSGLSFSDTASALNRQMIPALSFIEPIGFAAFAESGFNFKLSADVGLISLARGDEIIDFVEYGPQTTDVSEGRTPNGAARILFFNQPTPAASNPALNADTPTVILNEVFAKNISLRNPNGTISGWIEIFNPSPTRFNLGEVSVTDDLASPRKWIFAPDTYIEARAHLLIYCNAQLPANASNTGFDLNPDRGTIFIFDAPARGGALLDSIRYGIQVADHSLSRIDEAFPEWTLSSPTPAAINLLEALGPATSLRINEWMASVSNGPDWFEIFNTGAQPVALGNLYLTDALTDRDAFRIAPLSFIGVGAHAFVRLEADSDPEQGARHVGFNLSADGEEIGLYDAEGYPIDSVVFGAQQRDVSQGRLPDGLGPVTAFPLSASPGAPNYVLVDVDRDRMPDDWERVYFGNTTRDGAGDFDGDGLADLAEYMAGTDPANRQDTLRLELAQIISGVVRIHFNAAPGRAYRIEVTDDLAAGLWERFKDVEADNAPRISETLDSSASPVPRFYRLRLL